MSAPLHEQPVVREFAVRLDAPVELSSSAARPRASTRATRSTRDYPEHGDGLLVAITELRTREEIDRLAEALGAAVAAERGARAQVGA